MNFYEYARIFCNINLEEELGKVDKELNDMHKYFDNSKIVEKHLIEKLSKKLIEKHNYNELLLSDNISGHKFYIQLQKIIDNNPNEKCFYDIANAIVVDIARQSFSHYNMKKIMEGTNNTDNKLYKNLELNLIDIDKLLDGDLEWSLKTISKPDMSCFECLNDGKKYFITMDNWKIDFVDYNNFVINKKVSTIKPFNDAYKPVETKIEFKTKELVVFNFLPTEISDFIENHFSKSSFDFKGKDWDKFHNETLSCFEIFRTPSYCGGKVFQDNNYLILGRNEVNTNPDNNIGSTINTVWQTLIAEKENVIKLIMMANGMNRDEAEEYFQNEIIEEQDAIITNIEPGLYYSYCIPGNNNDRIEKDYKNIKMNDIIDIHIDMIISKKKIKTVKDIDSQNIIPQDESEKAKNEFESFENSSVSLKP
jgi:hypothetical protein